MLQNIFCLPRLLHSNALLRTTGRYCNNKSIPNNSVYEPNYLDSLKPIYPQYKNLNVQIKGYDYPILESYQHVLHGVAQFLGLNVLHCYALPSQRKQVQRMRYNSTIVDDEYQLIIYERNIHLINIEIPIYPVFLRIAQTMQPEGIYFQVQEHTSECEDRRYVPDKDLLALKTELDIMQTKPKRN